MAARQILACYRICRLRWDFGQADEGVQAGLFEFEDGMAEEVKGDPVLSSNGFHCREKEFYICGLDWRDPFFLSLGSVDGAGHVEG